MTIRLPEFLRKIDNITQNLTTEELLNLVHQIARTLPEDERDSFLELLNSCTNKTPNKNANDILFELPATLKHIEEIYKGDKYLTISIDEEWDDWYDDYEDQFIYHDESLLLDDIEKAAKLIHQCIDQEFYDPRILKLTQALSRLLVFAIEDDEYTHDKSTISLEELYSKDLLTFDFFQWIYESMYIIYKTTNQTNRPNEIYNFLLNFQHTSIKLEKFVQIGNHDLRDFDLFLNQWIELLIRQESYQANYLIKDAIPLLKDPNDLLVFAKENANSHPYLYLYFFENYANQYTLDQLLSTSLEAMQNIENQCIERNKIALYCASYANQMHDFKVVDKAYFEAFISDKNVTNYMRLRFESHDYQKYKDSVKQAIQSKDKNQPSSLYSNSYMDFITRDFQNLILFFETDFSEESISKFLEIPLSFMLLTLNNDDIPPYPKGLEHALYSAYQACDFNANDYYFGTSSAFQLDSYELFIKLFMQWKQTLKLSKNEEILWLQYLDNKIQSETESTLSNHHRSHYYSCATLISAYGEVLESRNQKGSLRQLIDSYKKKYPRFRAFHNELNKFFI